jgi:hypothetical protein
MVKVWTEEKIDILKREYPKGNAKRLCSILNVTYVALKGAAKKFKVKGKRTPFLNEYRLESLLEDTIENYYWMGFIMADGNITNKGQLRFSLARKDRNHLEKLAKKLDVPVIDEVVKNQNNSLISSMSCTDKINGLKLRDKMNINGSKTYNPPTLNFFKGEDFFWAFFAGFIDGDGCLVYRKGRIQSLQINCHGSWITNLEFFAQKLNSIDLRAVTKIDHRGYSLLTMSSGKDILKLRDKFVSLNLPLMERKWFRD